MEYERVSLDGVTAVKYAALDGTGRSAGKLTVYLREGVSTVDGTPYAGEELCVPGDRLIPWSEIRGDGLPPDGGYRIVSVEHRGHGSSAIRHMKIEAI